MMKYVFFQYNKNLFSNMVIYLLLSLLKFLCDTMINSLVGINYKINIIIYYN